MSSKSRVVKNFSKDDFDPEKDDVFSDKVDDTVPLKMGKDDYVVPVSAADSIPLIGILGSASDAAYTDRETYLKYNGSLTTTAVINGNLESSCKNIQYCLQAAAVDGNLARPGTGYVVLDDAIKVSDVLQSDITHASSRNSALPKTFKTVGLCAIVERLAKGIGKYAMYGTLTPTELRGGGQVKARSINAAGDNVAVGPGNVFVTKRATERTNPAVDCALFNAISGEGGTAYTDLLSIDGNGVAEVPVATDALLAAGCLEAANQIFRQYVQCGEGPAAAFAFFRGLNSVITLASHSDEGGYVRSVFRRGRYTTPFGAILISRDVTEYTGLPSPGGGVESFRRLAHSILIACAGGVANCDPMVNLGGTMYPTIITMTSGLCDDPGTDPSTDVPPTTDVRDAMQSKWARVVGDWATNYAYYVGTIFAAPGSTKSVVMAITTLANDMIGVVDSHMQTYVAVAFCWVEPTSITPFWDNSLTAMQHDCGALAVEGIERTVPFMRNSMIETKVGDQHTSLITELGYMRKHGLLVHLTANKANGMANIHLYSGTPSKFANVGGSGDMSERILRGDTLDTYQWGRLHSMVLAVGEFVELNPRVRLVFDHYVRGENAWDVDNAHVPGSHEFIDGKVTYRASRPYCEVKPAALVADNRTWVRARSAAAKAIGMAKERALQPSAAFGANIRPILGDPILSAPGVSSVDPITLFLDGRNTTPVTMDDVTVCDKAAEPSRAIGEITYGRGIPVPMVIHNVADKGRKSPRPTVMSTGGGSARIPAVENPLPVIDEGGDGTTFELVDTGMPGTAVI